MKKCSMCDIEIRPYDRYGAGNQKWYCMKCFWKAWDEWND